MSEVEEETTPHAQRIELVWPFKQTTFRPRQGPDGTWLLDREQWPRRLHPFVEFTAEPPNQVEVNSLHVSGDRLDALRCLSSWVPRGVRLAYLDVPRIEVDDKSAAFKANELGVYSTWLAVLSSHLDAIQPLVRRDGVVVIHTGDIEQAYAKLVADEYFGRDNKVATIVWQRSYGPRNMKGMKEFTATHDSLHVYALNKEFLPAVGLREAPTGFRNDDDDPRGPWKAEHKGAHTRREKSDFDTYVPPYRWRVSNGRLPTGLWRVNPMTGVIWGVPTSKGNFPFQVEVTDSTGKTARANLSISVNRGGEPPPLPNIPWLFKEIETSGKLRVTTRALLDAVMGETYSFVCLAAGGTPHRAGTRRPGSGRYWEFAIETLLKAYQQDEVSLGKDGLAIPHPKTYLKDVGEIVVKNQMSWWPGREQKGKETAAFAGYTEDATKHLKKLRELGFVKEISTTAKPEAILSKLLSIFTEPGDLALEVFGEAADLGAVSIKTGRRFIALAGSSDRDKRMVKSCAVPRLQAVIQGRDIGLEGIEGEIRMRKDAYIPYEGGGSFAHAHLGDWLFELHEGEELPRLNRSAYSDETTLRRAVLTAEGFLPLENAFVDGLSLDGKRAAVVLSPSDYLTPESVAQVVSDMAGKFENLFIYYFRASEDFDASTLPRDVVARRVPSEIRL